MSEDLLSRFRRLIIAASPSKARALPDPSPTPRAAGQMLAAIAAQKRRAERSAQVRRHITGLQADINRALAEKKAMNHE